MDGFGSLNTRTLFQMMVACKYSVCLSSAVAWIFLVGTCNAQRRAQCMEGTAQYATAYWSV